MTLSVRPWTDQELIDHYATSRFEEVKHRCARELAKRFADGFVVFDTGRQRYVESIDTFDGDTEWTAEKLTARIFSGQEWVEVWARRGVRFEKPEES